MAMEPGSLLNRFRLERLLGIGGCGTVWAALDTSSGERVALKLLHSKEVGSQRSRLEREAIALRRIGHPAIVTTTELFEHESGPVLVLELLQGETLRAMLVREGQLSPSALAPLLMPVADALSAAHSVGVVHRDLKPENIFVQTTPTGLHARLLDFGLARFVDVECGEFTPITELGSILGTLAYMAPEQALKPSDCDYLVDVWSLGVILYEALSGCRPIEGNTGPETMRQLLMGGITPLAVLVPELPNELAELVSQMLVRLPTSRLSSLSSVTNVLRGYLPRSLD